MTRLLVSREELEPLTVQQRISVLVDRYAPEKGDRQEHFARLVGASRKTVGRWVKGRSRPKPDFAASIAATTGLPVELFAAPVGEPLRELAEPLRELVAVAARIESAAARIEDAADRLAEERSQGLTRRAPTTRRRAAGTQ